MLQQIEIIVLTPLIVILLANLYIWIGIIVLSMKVRDYFDILTLEEVRAGRGQEFLELIWWPHTVHMWNAEIKKKRVAKKKIGKSRRKIGKIKKENPLV